MIFSFRMNQLPDEQEKLRKIEQRLRKQLFLAGENYPSNREEYEKKSLIRQAQKWKLEAVLQKKRTQFMLGVINEQRIQIQKESVYKKHAQAANYAMRQRVHELKHVQEANKRIIKEAQRWKKETILAQMKRAHEENTPTIVKEKEKMTKEITDLETKLKAAQRKLSLVRSNNQRLLNVEEEVAERRIRMRLMTEVIRSSKNNVRLEDITVREVLITAQKNYVRYRKVVEEKEEQRIWTKRIKKETEKLKIHLKEIISRGIELKKQKADKENQVKELTRDGQELTSKVKELENKLEEKEEELRYVEYLHDELYKKFGVPSPNICSANSIQSMSTASSTSSANLNY